MCNLSRRPKWNCRLRADDDALGDAVAAAVRGATDH